MSYSCARHEWWHLLNPCPSCYTISTTDKSVMNSDWITEAKINFDKLTQECEALRIKNAQLFSLANPNHNIHKENAILKSEIETLKQLKTEPLGVNKKPIYIYYLPEPNLIVESSFPSRHTFFVYIHSLKYSIPLNGILLGEL